MKATPAPLADLLVPVDKDSPIPLYLQLYEELRCRILQKTLMGGMKLPSTRTLSSSLDLSRNTVVAAFEQLLSEGYLEGRLGSGTYVADKLPEAYLAARCYQTAARTARQDAMALSDRGRALGAIRYSTSLEPHKPFGETKPVPFRIHTPALDQFPYSLWGKLLRGVWDRVRPEMLDCGDPAGYRPLRQAIATYVRASRAVSCDWQQVIVLPSSKTALHLAANLLLDPGDEVLTEEPSYQGFQAAFCQSGNPLIPVPVDGDGFDIQLGEKLCPGARMAYVTPSHQHPLGVTLSLPRRLALLAWARRQRAWILEDDYDSEFRYAGRPIASLQGLDDQGRVIYVGTFSKTLLPSLRLAYLIAPPGLVEAFRAARAHLDWASPTLEQAALAQFLQEGHFGRHVRRMRAIYQDRREVLREEGDRRLRGLLEFPERHTGLHLLGWLPPHVNDLELAHRAVAEGVEITPLSSFRARPGGRPGLLLGFAAFDEKQIRAGIERLAPLIERAMDLREKAAAS
jgi:GntR family transcriptional regulator / MocR family aminotransferase